MVNLGCLVMSTLQGLRCGVFFFFRRGSPLRCVMSPLRGLHCGVFFFFVGARPYAVLCRPFGACIVIFCPNGSGRTPDRTRVPNKGWR